MSKKEYFEDLTIIDLEAPANDTPPPEDEAPKPSHRKIAPRTLFHISTLGIAVFAVVFIIIRFSNFGVYIDQADIFENGAGEYEDTMDLILPVDEEFLEGMVDDGITTIVAFGNAPFADDRYSDDNLANLIAKETGAVVYNCSVADSYLAAQEYHLLNSTTPMDAYTFYWLACLACDLTGIYPYNQLTDALGTEAPEAIRDTLQTLTELDFNTVDAIAIMYDATDYYMGNYIYDISNHSNHMAFTGNLIAGIEAFQNTYPHIRIIVMSPSYAFYVDENGNYLSSDQYKYNEKEDILSTYCIYQGDMCSEKAVTFIDNIYGTITEDNASEYLKDHLHLNQKGRQEIAQRFIYALNYFNE